MLDLFILIELFVIGTIFVAMALLVMKDGAKEQKLMSYFLCGILIQNVGYLLELTAPTLEAAVIAVKMQYLGSIFVPLCYCWFIYAYCYRDAPVGVVRLLALFDLCVLLVVFSFDRNRLYYRQYEWLRSEDGHNYLRLTYGPVYLVFLICGCVIPYIMSSLVLLRSIIVKPKQAANRKYKSIFLLSLLPVLSLGAYVGKFTNGFDPTPAVMGVVLSLVVILVWRSRTYDFEHLAADTVLDSMGDGVIALDAQRRILSYNKAAALVFTELSADKKGDSIDTVSGFPKDMMEEGVNKEFSLNDRFYEGHVKDIVDEDGKNQGCVILLLDVTDTRNYIEEIIKVREQAKKANAAKSEFLANMSHEIRTPMNAIVGLSDIIMEESQGRKLYFYANDIKSASKNLLAIINDILDLSKVEAGKMELVTSDYYVKAIVDEVVNMMDIAASQRGLLMKYEYDKTIPCRYHGDEGRIKQILINIMNNAIKFTKEGYVKICIGGRQGNAPDEELLVFRVEDSGCGIREEDKEKIFDNFRRVDSALNQGVEGTGLGLSITKHLVQLMHGQIELESVYGEGTTFTITIPQRIVDKRTLEEVPELPVKESEKIKAFVAKGYKVLVVDDNLINRRVAKSLLASYQFDLTEAKDGFEAIELVKKNKFQLIFMDHMMPEMDGIETVRRIRWECGENGKEPIIIALTANAMEGVRGKFLSSGFQDFIPKPLDKKQLNDALIKWVPDEFKEEQVAGGEEPEESGSDARFGDIRIKGIDMDAVRRLHNSTVEEYKELLQLYYLDGKRKIKLLNKLYEEKNYRNYEIEVHGLKSASANIGAAELSGLAREHEEAVIGGDLEFVETNFSQLIDAYEEQLMNIGSFLDKQKEDDRTEESLKEIDAETLRERLKEALAQLQKFRSKECANEIDGLLQYRLETDTEAKLKEIRELLKLYEDDMAEQSLGELLERLDKEK